MVKNRYIGDYPVIGICPTIDGRRGPLKVCESMDIPAKDLALLSLKLMMMPASS